MVEEKIFIEDFSKSLLLEEGVITEADTNLMSKTKSLLRDIKNLEDKIRRLEFEIKLKKKALVRKREEVRKTSNSITVKAKLLKESNADEESASQALNDLRREIQILLTESYKALCE